MATKICKDGRIWGQTNKEAGKHLGILTGHQYNYNKEKAKERHRKNYVKKGYNMNSGASTRFKKGHKSPCTMLGKHHSKETKAKMKRAHKGRVFTEEWRRNIGIARSCPHLNQRGANAPNWKGGITSLHERIRNCFEYRQWRSDIFTRDDFTCQECGDAIGGNLEAHHKIEFADILERHEITNFKEAINCEELWNINNGVTLCKDCHKLEHSKQEGGVNISCQ